MSEWISVKNELPDNGYYIVAYYNPSDSSKKLYVVTAWMGRDGWYWDNSEKEPAEDETLKITYWMPLPEPPKIKKREAVKPPAIVNELIAKLTTDEPQR